jgi:hypothetical protein
MGGDDDSLLGKASSNRPVLRTMALFGFIVGAPVLIFSIVSLATIAADKNAVDSYFEELHDSCMVVDLSSEEKELKRYGPGGTAYTSCTDVYTYTFTSDVVPGLNLTSDKERLERCQAPCNQCSNEQVPATLQVGSTYDCWQSMNKADLPNDLECPNTQCIMIQDPAGKIGDGPSPWILFVASILVLIAGVGAVVLLILAPA